jgi:hypothetical protein
MTDTSHSRSADSEARYGNAQTAWAGWVIFGGVMLIMLGAFQIVEGLVALFDDGFYLVGRTSTTTPGAGSTPSSASSASALGWGSWRATWRPVWSASSSPA